MMFVYVSPLVGGWLADRKLGYRRAVIIGGFFFMAGHLLLSVRSLAFVYAALTCLVIGNGFFKPNVSTMVGNLYPDGSRLKDRAYNLFYMGINVGAFLAPVVATVIQAQFGFHPAFAVAALGMVISVAILWRFKGLPRGASVKPRGAARPGGTALGAAIDAVAEWKRIAALIVIFAVVVVFWMVFHQNGTTITYWADENTDWNVRGIIANAINPAWVIILTPPLIAFWKWLDARGLEPATPIKMVIGMAMTSLAFLVLFLAAKSGEATVTRRRHLRLQGVAGVAARRVRRADARRVDAVADGAVARVEGGAPALARHDDGRLVRRHRPGQQADADRGVLDGVEALDVLARAERRRRGDGGRAAHPVEAAAKGHAGGVKRPLTIPAFPAKIRLLRRV